MVSTSFGFPLPDQDVATLLDYDVLVDGVSIAKETTRQDIAWSDRAVVTVSAELEVDLDRLAKESGHSSVSLDRFWYVIDWKATGSGLHGASPVSFVSDGINELSFDVPGELLGDELILKPRIVIASPESDNLFSVAPSRSGSRLWEVTIRVRLEGDGSQFPTSKVDFREAGFEPSEWSSPWKLRISGSLDSHFSSAVRLYLNTGSERMRQYIQNPNAKTQREFGKFLEADIATQLLRFAFAQEISSILDIAQEPGTLAEGLLQIYGTYFSTLDFAEAQTRFRDNPSFPSGIVLGSTFVGKDG